MYLRCCELLAKTEWQAKNEEGVAPMKSSLIAASQAALILIAIGAITFLLVEPHYEGRNANSTLFEVYFNDAFLVYAYVGSIPLFVAVYKAFYILRCAGCNQAESPACMRAFGSIKYCAIALIVFVSAGLLIILFNDSDDRAGGVAICGLIILGSIVVAIVAAILERILRKTLIHVPAA
jgi:Protein of unknown function (DUF2975)